MYGKWQYLIKHTIYEFLILAEKYFGAQKLGAAGRGRGPMDDLKLILKYFT